MRGPFRLRGLKLLVVELVPFQSPVSDAFEGIGARVVLVMGTDVFGAVRHSGVLSHDS